MLDVAREYCLLGLRFNRIVDGFVDAYFGDPALARQVDDEPAPDPRALAAAAERLRGDVASSDLSPARRDYLDAQLTALAMNGRRLAGDEVPYVDEVAAYFQVRPELGDTSAYADAHDRIAELLPGDGPLAERYVAFRERDIVPPDRLEEALHAFSSDLRDRARAGFGLPDVETVEYEIVTDKPWSGFNYYLGNYRSRVAINADLPMRKSDLPSLVAHESYPGHHTEHCRKERLLVEGERQHERTIFLVNTPECLMAEGLADLGLRAAVGAGWGAWARSTYADVGVTFDGELAEAVLEAARPLSTVRQDVAMLMHDRGATQDEAVAYSMRWGLATEERARKSVQFVTSPLWRAYISTYVEGVRLLGDWLDAGDAPARFQRLLDEPLTPAALAADLAV